MIPRATAGAVREVLVVEDDALMAAVYRGLFARLSGEFAATLAPDAATARALLAERDFDIAILDRDLPDADGLSLLPSLRARGPRVLVASGRARDADRSAALAAGADDFLSKPFETEDLVARLRALGKEPA